MCGLVLDPWQRLVVRITLATCEGRLAAAEVGFLVARQNGKGGALEAIALYSLFIEGGLTLWTAHELKTSDEAYLRVKALIKGCDELAAQVVKWDGGLTGQHIIELRNGARLQFVARSKSSGRGFSPRRIIFDEAQELGNLAHRAMLYATSAKAGRQCIYTGTVPDVDNDSTIFTGVRDRGRAGKSTRLAWAEWTPKGSDDPRTKIDPESWEVRAYSNPALGTRILHETVDGEWESAQAAHDIDGFMRERVSVWPSPLDDAGTGVIDAAAWADCKADLEQVTSPVVLVVETSQDRTRSWLMTVGTRPDGLAQVEMVPVEREHPDVVVGEGTAWVPGRIAEVVAGNPDIATLALDSYAAAAPLVPRIEAAVAEALEGTGRELEIRELNGPDFVDACSTTDDAIRDRTLRHGGSPALTEAVKAAQKRDREGVWVWSRSKTGHAGGPLMGMTVGLWVWAQADEYDPMDGIGF